jgi:hypothetical protein
MIRAKYSASSAAAARSSSRARPVMLQGGLLPVPGRLFPVDGLLVAAPAGPVAVGGQVVAGCRVLVALLGCPVLLLGLLFLVREPAASAHGSTLCWLRRPRWGHRLL